MKKIPETTIEKLIETYAVLLLDAYGVLLDMSGALPGAIELITALSRTKKPYFILTNDASRLVETSARHYRDFGLRISPDRIITSGILLKTYFEQNQLAGARCVVLGPEDSVRYVEMSGGTVVSPGEEFEILVIGDEAGYPFLETVDTVLTTLFQKLDRQETVHLVLPNPDMIYPKSDKDFGIASGSVAIMLETALESRYKHHRYPCFERLGKPHRAIFQEALRRSGTMNMAIIGDQLETDIRGAIDFGIDSVLVTTGVAQADIENIPENCRPTYYMQSLKPNHDK